jgi:hypothetical protein
MIARDPAVSTERFLTDSVPENVGKDCRRKPRPRHVHGTLTMAFQSLDVRWGMEFMRSIQIEEKLWVRFPARNGSFLEGVEIGALAAHLATAVPELRRTISAAAFEQAKALAAKFGYRALAGNDAGTGMLEVTFTTRRRKPQLRLISSNG